MFNMKGNMLWIILALGVGGFLLMKSKGGMGAGAKMAPGSNPFGQTTPSGGYFARKSGCGCGR